MSKLSDRLAKMRNRKRAKKQKKMPQKRFADGSLWVLDPVTYEPIWIIEQPNPSKGWNE